MSVYVFSTKRKTVRRRYIMCRKKLLSLWLHFDRKPEMSLGFQVWVGKQQCSTVNPNPVQLTAFPCKSIPTGKNLLSLQGNPVLIAGSLFWLKSFPCISLYFPVRDCSVGNLTFTYFTDSTIQSPGFSCNFFLSALQLERVLKSVSINKMYKYNFKCVL